MQGCMHARKAAILLTHAETVRESEKVVALA